MSPNNKSRKRVLNTHLEDEIGLITPQRRCSHPTNIANAPQPARPSVKCEPKLEAAADELGLTEYPTRVSGTRVQLDAKPIGKDYVDRIRVDKTLVCKGFWDRVDYITHICLPHCADYAAYSCERCESFFKDSLLKKKYPEFFAEHFMKRSVIYISFESCKFKSCGSMAKLLCQAIARTAQRHLDEFKYAYRETHSIFLEAEKSLRTRLETVYKVCSMSDDDTTQYGGLPLTLFSALSRFVHQQYGSYILLVDEYDVPFLSLFEGTWDKVDKEGAIIDLRHLFWGMCKGNYDVYKGLLAGVIDVDIANDVYILQDICLIPKHLRYNDENGCQVSTLDCFGSKKCDLANAFWFNEREVALMLALCTTWFDGTSGLHGVILDNIREHYGGYYIDYSDNKYNP
ncbi:hypothetical protein GGH93_001237 [Coemansia aciculifera]|nr:hypothetical protein GGH93_001237 [Coemansia aciculifera]